MTFVILDILSLVIKKALGLNIILSSWHAIIEFQMKKIICRHNEKERYYMPNIYITNKADIALGLITFLNIL